VPQACKDAIAAALEGVDRSRVRGAAVSGQQHGLVALDADGAVVRPAKLWCDVESADEARELSAAFNTALVPAFTATKLLWLKRHEPASWAALAHVLLPHDYINYWLTGRFAMEASDASGTGLFDPVRRCWDDARALAVDAKLRGCLPAVLGPDEAVGSVRDELADEMRLPRGVVVAPGGGDNAMSALGAGAVTEGVWLVSLGTSGVLFGTARQPVIDPTGVICPFCDATGQGLPLVCTLNCTSALEEVRRSHGLDHAAITELAAEEEPGCSGVTFLPFFAGERTPNLPGATGALLGLRPGLMRPGLVYRACMEGATFSLVDALAGLQSHGLAASELRVVGGGSKNPLWRRVLADAAQLPLRFPAEPEAAALGACLQAGAVCSGMRVSAYVELHQPPLEPGVLQPDPEQAAVYSSALRRHVALRAQLFGGGSGAPVTGAAALPVHAAV
jgi:xylulokinase